MASSKSRVLSCYRTLQRACQSVFKGDQYALAAGRTKINEEFRKCKDEQDPEEIEKMIEYGNGACEFLLTEVVQAKLNEETGNYELKMREELPLVDNKMYDENDPAPPCKKHKK